MKKSITVISLLCSISFADVIVNTTGSEEMMSQDNPIAEKCNVDDTFVDYVEEFLQKKESIPVESLCQEVSSSTEEERQCKTNVPKQIKCVEKALVKK